MREIFSWWISLPIANLSWIQDKRIEWPDHFSRQKPTWTKFRTLLCVSCSTLSNSHSMTYQSNIQYFTLNWRKHTFDDLSFKLMITKEEIPPSLSFSPGYTVLFPPFNITIQLQLCRCSSPYQATFLMKFRLNKTRKNVSLTIQWRWVRRDLGIWRLLVLCMTIMSCCQAYNIEITDWSCSILLATHTPVPSLSREDLPTRNLQNTYIKHTSDIQEVQRLWCSLQPKYVVVRYHPQVTSLLSFSGFHIWTDTSHV